MSHRVLAIANRGEIAVRIARTARKLGWQPVALLGDPDLASYAAREVGWVERVGPAGTELDVELVMAAALRAGASALHPGYGFLSERAELSAACAAAGITFVGPSPATLGLCGDKIATREAARQAGVPVLPSSAPVSPDGTGAWAAAADEVGFPLMVKVAGGGGGRGLRAALHPRDLDDAINSALREAGATGAGTRLYLERYLVGARHVEVQVAGDGEQAVALGDRDCSIQRRHQKVIEEAPAPGLADNVRAALHTHAVTLARAVGLLGVATVEFLLGSDGTLAFIEINPRLQVEHTVTEEVSGLDLVEIQLALASGGQIPTVPASRGHAIQARLYAEDPTREFVPSPGSIVALEWPQVSRLRIDYGYEAGDSVPSFYDAMLGKLIASGRERADALDVLVRGLRALRVGGIATNRPWLLALLADDSFRENRHSLSTAESIDVAESVPPDAVLSAVASAAMEPSAGGRAWSSGPFRMVGQATQVLHGDEAGGWQVGLRFRGAKAGWRVAEDGGDSPELEASGVAILPTDGGYDTSAPAGRWFVKPGARPTLRARDQRLDGAVRAPMPGTLLAMHVTTGQRVTKDQVLAVMVAMKIEIALAAPFDGIVDGVSAQPGELVSIQQVIVQVSPAGQQGEGGHAAS